MIDFHRNNLDKAISPYLQQHKNNPIHWQEWNEKTLAYAGKENKLILVSIGYATCHWCHVMAAETFENREVAGFLNEHFVSIKVDREQRPDIDQYFMTFITRTTGQGGWPLNVFLTSHRKPILALTYAPVKSKYGMPAFIEILKEIKNKGVACRYKDAVLERSKEHIFSDGHVLQIIASYYDHDYGGFGYSQKFPPYNTLLFLLSCYERMKTRNLKMFIEKTLDAMAHRGLHDHLQGGFFRYCVDRNWTVPHFEKMLYDQAMLLWVYSAAYKVLEKEEYKKVAERIMTCLEETFEDDGLFYSAHDADTNHEEGATYLWARQELKEVLTEEEFRRCSETYEITEHGNFEGKNHLIKKKEASLPEIERKLLAVRKKRNQPFVDKKIITSWNALAGIGLVMAWRCTANINALEKAKNLFTKLLEKHYDSGKLHHSSLGNKVQEEGFLEDYAAVFLLITYLHEETGEYRELLASFSQKVQLFKKGEWIESNASDFMEVVAESYDHPTPSSVSLAEFGLLRMNILLGQTYSPTEYRGPLHYDFYNLIALVSSGTSHIIHSPERLDWNKLPLNSIQARSGKIMDCYQMKCKEFKSTGELFTSF